MARSGDPAGAKAEIEGDQGSARPSWRKPADSYWAARSEEHILAVSAWIALRRRSNRDQALKFMRAAADLEDGRVKHVAMENELYPLRELLAEMLLETGQAPAGLRESKTSLKANPQPLPHLLWRRARRRCGRQPEEGGGLLRKAGGAFQKR